jgi:hypothetical protein
MTKDEALQMALDALECWQRNVDCNEPMSNILDALRAALAQHEKEWVSLTAEELAEISEFHFHGAFSGREIYEDIETKLKEKNNG